MTELSAAKMAVLREIAGEASMGRWRVVVDDARNEVRVDTEGAWIAWTGGIDEVGAEFDAEHIAAFSPPMALDLLDRIEELETELTDVEYEERTRFGYGDKLWRRRKAGPWVEVTDDEA